MALALVTGGHLFVGFRQVMVSLLLLPIRLAGSVELQAGFGGGFIIIRRGHLDGGYLQLARLVELAGLGMRRGKSSQTVGVCPFGQFARTNRMLDRTPTVAELLIGARCKQPCKIVVGLE